MKARSSEGECNDDDNDDRTQPHQGVTPCPLPRARDPGATAREPVGACSRDHAFSPLFSWTIQKEYGEARHQRAVSGPFNEKNTRHVARLASRPCRAVFLDLRGLAVTLTQVVELGAAHVALGDIIDVVDRGGRTGKVLDAHTEGKRIVNVEDTP